MPDAPVPPGDSARPGPAAPHLPAGAAVRSTALWRILDAARWAPSGDNTQPWRFEIVSDDHVAVHAFDTRHHCVYDIAGQASQLSVGALLETIRIAASAHGRSAEVKRRADAPEEFPVFDVRLRPAPGATVDPLEAVIATRSVQRKPLATRPLTADEKAALAASVGPGYRVAWFEGPGERRRMAWLAVRSARIRLTIPEAFAVHRDIIAWGQRFSDDRVPDQALGASPLSLRSMRFAMASWERVRLLNRFAGGTWMPRLELDLLPALRCAAHFALIADRAPAGIDDHVAAGAAVQRFWLTAARLGLQLQPQYTPLVFAAYARHGIAFTGEAGALRRAVEVAARLGRLLGEKNVPATVFLGRIGAGAPAASRSLRRPLEALLWKAVPGVHADPP